MTCEEQKYCLERESQWDAKYLPAAAPVLIKKGCGALLTDANGHELIDMHEITANIGHVHPEHTRILHRVLDEIITEKGTLNPYRAALLEKLNALTNANLNKVFFCTSGSEVIDWALRIARRFQARHETLSFWGGCYGRTTGAMSASTLLRRKTRFGPLVPGSVFTPYPYCYRCPFQKERDSCDFYCIDYMDQVLAHETTGEVGTLIVEPYLGVAGVIFPPDGYLARLQQWAKERDILFILDETQSSFGRTGKMFAYEWENLQPDLLCVGKGMGGGIPIAALIADAEIMATVDPAEISGGTGGNPLATASALAVIEIIEREELVAQAEQIGRYFRERLRKMQGRFKVIGDVRGKGLALGVELVKDRVTKEPLLGLTGPLRRYCYQNGVYLATGPHMVTLRPPLVITAEQAERVADVIEAGLAELTG